MLYILTYIIPNRTISITTRNTIINVPYFVLVSYLSNFRCLSYFEELNRSSIAYIIYYIGGLSNKISRVNNRGCDLVLSISCIIYYFIKILYLTNFQNKVYSHVFEFYIIFQRSCDWISRDWPKFTKIVEF